MKHTPATDAVIELLLGVLDETKLQEIIDAVPEYVSAPLDEEERLEWLSLAADLHDDFPDTDALAEVAAIYAQTPGGFAVAGVEFMPTNQVNIVKSIEAGQCSAKRCGSESIEIVTIDGRRVPLCQKHIDACVLSGQLGAPETETETETAAERTLPLPGVEPLIVSHEAWKEDNRKTVGPALEKEAAFSAMQAPAVYTAELATETEAAKSDLEAIEDFSIATQDDMDTASAVISEAHERHEKLEARLREITQPMRTAEKSVRDLFRPALTALADIERIVKGKVGAYKLEQDARNAAALKAAAEAVAKGEDASKVLANVVHTENTAGIGTRDVWKWEVLDEEAVPRAFCSPDDRKIREAIEKEGYTDICGLRIYKDVAVRRT